MASDIFYVSIDIGTNKITVLLAEERDGKLSIFGHATGKSQGVEKGLIYDQEKVSKVIASVKKEAQLSCKTHISSVITNIADPDIKIFNRNPSTYIISGNISQRDIDSITTIALSTKKNNEQMVGFVHQYFTLDNRLSIREVTHILGMRADKLELSLFVFITCNHTVNIIGSILGSQELYLADILPNAMASCSVILNQYQKDKGVCVIDIGAGTTDIAVFIDGDIAYITSLQVAGKWVTYDISDELDLTFEEAEQIKIESSEPHINLISKSYEKIFLMVKNKLEEKGLYTLLIKESTAGFILTGGGSKFKDCAKLMTECIGKRSRIGQIDSDLFSLNNDDLSAPEYSCALGLLLYQRDKFKQLDCIKQPKRKLRHWIAKYNPINLFF